MPTDKEDLPGTIQRSPRSAQRTYSKALDISGRLSMTKHELGQAIARTQD